MKSNLINVSFGLCVASLVAGAGASVGIDVRDISGGGPIISQPAPFTPGPPSDPFAANGQWFRSIGTNGLPIDDFRTHEFHDNIAGSGGGPIPGGGGGNLAIQGIFAGWIPGGPGVIGYSMNVSITNNNPAVIGPFAEQSSQHGERRIGGQPYTGDMLGVRFVSHWASTFSPGQFQVGGPHVPSTITAGGAANAGTSNTYAANNDATAWYCWTNLNPGGSGHPQGDYQVAAWDFGNISVGQTVTRTLTFMFYNGLNASMLPTVPSTDLLIARSNDIRVASFFQDDPVMWGITDTGTAYPNGSSPSNPILFPQGYGNSSVFFNIPTPGAASAAGLLMLAAIRRRRANGT
jgi:hypothetical protein